MPKNLSNFLESEGVGRQEVYNFLESLKMHFMETPPQEKQLDYLQKSAAYTESGLDRDLFIYKDDVGLLSDYIYNILGFEKHIVFMITRGFSTAGYLERFISKSDIPSSAKLAIMRAAFFDLFKVGNCSHRAAYLAFKLCSIMPNHINIKFTNYVDKDQYYVMLINKKTEAKYYIDVLYNPFILLTQHEFTGLLAQMQTATHIGRKVDVSLKDFVTPDIFESFRNKLRTDIKTVLEKEGGLSKFIDSENLTGDVNEKGMTELAFIDAMNSADSSDRVSAASEAGIFHQPCGKKGFCRKHNERVDVRKNVSLRSSKV